MTKPFVTAYNRETGKKQDIPAHWLYLPHPHFSKFSKTPRQRRAERVKNPAPEPVNTETATEPVADTTESEG